MLRARPPVFSSLRLYSQFPELPSVKLVPQLRELTEVSIAKAREALAASDDMSAALASLQNDLAVSGAQKAAKLSHRAAGEGRVGASVLARGTGSGASHGGARAALVEPNCETDFVASNVLFACLVEDFHLYCPRYSPSQNLSPIRTVPTAASITYRASNSSTHVCL
ncbi:hypothetical protein EDB89DRAFT_1275779 [Lactarius sanguifluus]|nr:hypothetical protein EDB89DRAFT_1275779 [Lactarius sanguifluus]